MVRRRLLLVLLLHCALLIPSWSIQENVSLSPLSLEIIESMRRLDQNYYNNDDEYNTINEQCSEYLVSFLEGSTDAKDTCEGIQNAYTEANCGALADVDNTDDQDDYFGVFYSHKCCQSLLNRHAEYCDGGDLLSNMHMLFVAALLLVCEVAKAVVKSYNILWLPEAAVCILVGTVTGIIGHLIPGLHIDDISFDGELFLTILLPPIIFEAALSVSKVDFRRRRLAIFMFAVVGTILSTLLTGSMVHVASVWLPSSTDIPMLDCIIYGALISSIDPVAILSVLSSLNLSQTDTLFILVFGESLLNDGVAITITQNLSTRFGQGMNIDVIFGAIADFLIVAVGSISLGFFCAILAMLFYWIFGKLLNPGMEVGSFFLWAMIPYWICDHLDWSGILSIVTMGFFMDVYVAAQTERALSPPMRSEKEPPIQEIPVMALDGYNHMDDELTGGTGSKTGVTGEGTVGTDGDPRDIPELQTVMSYHSDGKRVDGRRSLYRLNILRLLIHKDRIRLSPEADKHVRFVAHLMAQLCENAIFAYLGLFLLSANYEWDIPLVISAVVICIFSRALMVMTCCSLVWYINIFRRNVKGCGYETQRYISRTATQIQDRRMQLVLMFAGLRGAVSLALVENIPLFNNVTKEGCEFKPVLKAMASASIIFTMFVFGGSAHYIFPRLGVKPDDPVDESVSGLSKEQNEKEPYFIRFLRTPTHSGPPRVVGTLSGSSPEAESQNQYVEMGRMKADDGHMT